MSKAVLYPEDEAYITRWDEQVQHPAVASWDRVVIDVYGLPVDGPDDMLPR